MKLSRRVFLKSAAAGSSLYTLGRAVPALAAPVQFKALVCVELLGGVDNFLFALPLNLEDDLEARRGDLMTSIYADPFELGNGTDLGMHPALQTLNDYRGNMRLTLGGVNCHKVKPTRSHELAQARFALGRQEGGGKSLGWKGRLYDSGVPLLGFDGAKNQNFNCASCGTTPPTVVDTFEKFKLDGEELHWQQGGAENSKYVADIMERMVKIQDNDRPISEIETAYHGGQKGMFAAAKSIAKTLGYTTPHNLDYPNTVLGNRFRNIAQSLKQAIIDQTSGPLLYVLAQNGYDFHDNFLTRADSLLGDLGASLQVFLDDCSAMGILDNVVVTTETDFGRQIGSNGSGTDHGEGMVSLTLGGRINGGTNLKFGEMLTSQQIGQENAWPGQFDSRALLCDILQEHLGVNPEIAFPEQDIERPNFNLFKA